MRVDWLLDLHLNDATRPAVDGDRVAEHMRPRMIHDREKILFAELGQIRAGDDTHQEARVCRRRAEHVTLAERRDRAGVSRDHVDDAAVGRFDSMPAHRGLIPAVGSLKPVGRPLRDFVNV